MYEGKSLDKAMNAVRGMNR